MEGLFHTGLHVIEHPGKHVCQISAPPFRTNLSLVGAARSYSLQSARAIRHVCASRRVNVRDDDINFIRTDWTPYAVAKGEMHAREGGAYDTKLCDLGGQSDEGLRWA